MTAPLLEVRNVSRFFGGVKANVDVSFSVEPGMVLGLIGPNGAGKTTLFNCITGFFPPSRGEILFEGRRIDGLSPGTWYYRVRGIDPYIPGPVKQMAWSSPVQFTVARPTFSVVRGKPTR